MTTFAESKMNAVRKRIVAAHPRMGTPTFAAALGNAMIAECWLELTPPSKRLAALASHGYFGDEADSRIADLAEKERAHNG